MATVNKIDTTFTGKDIHTAASVYEYTANGTYKVRFQIQLTSLAGGGDYSVWATLNDGDAVGDYVIHPKTTITLAAGAQSIWIVSGEIDVMSGDVINIFALGLAGDTSVAGIVRVFSDDATAVATLADDAITAAKFDESTAFPVKSADTGSTAIARVGADSDTLETLSDQLDLAALEATLTAIKGAGWTTETLVTIQAAIAAIVNNDYTALLTAIQNKTDQLAFSVPNKVDANADVVLSQEAIENMAAAIGEGLTEDIWSSSMRTLTQSPAEIIATVYGADITQVRGNSWVVQLTGVVLESIQQLAIKYNAKQPDSAAVLFVDSVSGLTVLNGAAQDGEDSDKASLIYDGTILTLTVDASITAQLPVGSLQYGIQSIADNGIVSEPYRGTFRVLADIVRATD